MKKYSWVLILVLFANQQNMVAQTVSKVGTTAASFLKIGVGARSLGMGGSAVTTTEDASSMYWNPAGLGRLTQNQFIFDHFDYIAGLRYDFAGISIAVPNLATFGLSLTYLGGENIERTTLSMQEGTGEMVSYGSVCAGLSFGIALTDRFSFGATGKYIRESLWHCHASAIAADMGIIFHTQFKNLILGMSISNFGTTLKMDGRDLLVQHDIDQESEGNNSNINADLSTDEFTLPTLFRVGMSMNILRDLAGLSRQNLILSIDAIHPNDNKEYLQVGCEYLPIKHIALRAGYRELFLKDSEGNLTMGAGLSYPFGSMKLNLDYAYCDFGRLDNVNKFTFMLSF